VSRPPHDAILVVSFGGPEGPDDVMPFLERVTRGRGVPPERLAETAAHYDRFGGVSPINGQVRDLVSALELELAEHGPHLPVYWGNRNWHPLLTDTMQAMAADGVRRAAAFVTSAFASYSGCRQYLEDIERARAEVGADAPLVDKLRLFYNHPRFIELVSAATAAAVAHVPEARRANARLVFTAHSLPASMAATCDYEPQLREAAALVVERLPVPLPWDRAYQSRSGPPSQPWLGPDVNEHLEALASTGVTDVVLVPLGFVSDHMEVVYDLDVQARETAERLGIGLVRAATPGSALAPMIRELVVERIELPVVRPALGRQRPWPDVCPVGCCPPPPPPPSRRPGER